MSEPASRLGSFLAELKRRKVYRVAVVYAVVAFVIWQVADVAFEPLHLPPWALTFVVVLVIIGCPIALVLAWALEITPEGIRRTPSVDPGAEARVEEREGPAGEAAPRASIAVLPFADMSPERDQEFFCDGMAEELLNALAQLPGLRVAARTSSFAFRGKDVGVREIGRELAVAAVLEGSVRRSGDRLRVAAQLVNAEDGYHLWSQTYERELADVFVIQDEISRSILERLRPALVGELEPRPVTAPTRSMEAYEHYLQGRYYWHRRYKVGLETALSHFQAAVDLDPEYALPYTGIADTYTTLAIYGFIPPHEVFPKARAAAERALELDEGLSEAHASLGWYHIWCGWDWAAAERELLRAIELNPNHAEARAWYAMLMAYQGRFAEAFDQAAAARRLDPLSTYVAAMSGAARWQAREYEAAIWRLEDVVAKEPESLMVVFMLSLSYLYAQRHDDAVAMGERAVALSNRGPFFLGLLAGCYGQAGRDDEARAILAELTDRTDSEYVSPLFLAWGYGALREFEECFEYLARAVAEGSPFLGDIHQAAIWDPVRSDPRFRQVADQVGSGVVKSYSPSD